MQKTILITGSTDGIGLEATSMLVSQGHNVLLHGRNPAKLEEVARTLSGRQNRGRVESYVCDLSQLSEVVVLANEVAERHTKLDVLINNAGVLKTSIPTTQEGLDVRFVVNAIAPYLLTKNLLPLMGTSGRVINLSSAAQSPVDPEALAGHIKLSDDLNAYAQSKLAITMWSRSMALSLKGTGPVIIAVNPGSLLGTKMVKEGFGIAGKDIRIGAEILTRLALSDDFDDASGLYFDNDTGRLASPHPDALDPEKSQAIVHAIEAVILATAL
ncbi:MAG: oxidoreductase [Sedimenticola sp.]|nr:MAG: oxidoreductase [Sedimenticola sp.]